MASVSRIAFQHFELDEHGAPGLRPGRLGVIEGLPVLYFSDGRMWEEASMYLASWARDIAEDEAGGDLQSVQSSAWQLRAYLEFCEEKSLDPMRFGKRRYEKPTYMFKGRLIQQRDGKATRDNGSNLKQLAASTVSNRIAAVARFFLWLIDSGTAQFEHPPCKVKHITIHTRTAQGLGRSIQVRTTDLAIRYRAADRNTVEGGLKPVSLAMRDEILEAARKHCSIEFALMLELGFRSGPRIQTICALKCATLAKASKRRIESLLLLPVGPKHGVATKGGVNYELQVPLDLLERLREYATSPRRMLRVAKASEVDRDVLFLNRFGKRYNRRGADQSTSVAQDMARLRRATKGVLDLASFYFHCSRATFGTSIVNAGLRAGVSLDRILSRLKTLMGHKDAKTSLTYVHFVEKEEENSKIDEELCA